MMWILNVLDERVPAGKSEDDNQVVRTCGTPPSLDFEPKDHHDLGTDRHPRPSDGSQDLGGSVLCTEGAGARLERALINFFADQGWPMATAR